MIERWREGFDVVYAQRRIARRRDAAQARSSRPSATSVIRRVAEVDIPPNTGDFRLMSRRVVDEVVRSTRRTASCAAWSRWSASRRRACSTTATRAPTGDGKYNRFLGSLRDRPQRRDRASRAIRCRSSPWIGLLTFAFAMLLALAYLC